MSAPASAGRPLLVVIDPAARRCDAESVRIVRDVLCAGAAAKICLPDGPEDVARALAHRGRRSPVVVGDDLALRRMVALLHRERELADAALALVPVGASAGSVALARELGVPTDPVAAARAVLDGTEHRFDLLVDDSDGVVLGGLSIPAAPGGPGGPGEAPWWSAPLRGCRSLVRSGARSLGLGPGGRPDGGPGTPGDGGGPAGHRLRVEADGRLLVDLDQPVEDVWVSVRGGGAPGAAEPRGGAPGGPGRPGRPGRGPGGLSAGEAAAGIREAGGDRAAAGTGGAGEGHGRDGLARVVVRPAADGGSAAPELTARARAITVSGADFRYRADAVVGGPVRTRTWTVRPGALRLTLPRQAGPGAAP